MKSRKALWIIALIIVMAAVLSFYFFADDGILTKQFFCMDTSVKLSASNDNIDKYARIIKKLDKSLSAYSSKSEISKLNKNGNAKLSDLTVDLLKKAKALTADYPQVDITAGALTELWNINSDKPKLPKDSYIQSALKTVGSDNIAIKGNDVTLKSGAKVDLGSCAKGYALDLLFDEFEKSDEKCAVLSFGSSTLLFGGKSDGKPFVTAVSNPDDSNSQVLEFKSGQCFVSTSGGYERFFEIDGKRYCHIIDLKTGSPAESDLTSVTVISKDNGLLTDFLSTCIFIDGVDNIEKYLNDNSYEVIALGKDKKIYCSKSIKDKIKITNDNYSFK